MILLIKKDRNVRCYILSLLINYVLEIDDFPTVPTDNSFIIRIFILTHFDPYLMHCSLTSHTKVTT